MYPEFKQLSQWLRCKNPHSSTHIHYASDLKFFLPGMEALITLRGLSSLNESV